MSKRVPTYVKSPYVGTFQYPNAGPNHIHENPNQCLLPANMPFIGTFRHNMPLFLPSFLRTQTRDSATQTEHSCSESSKKNIHKETQTEEVSLETFVIVKYPPEDTTDL